MDNPPINPKARIAQMIEKKEVGVRLTDEDKKLARHIKKLAKEGKAPKELRSVAGHLTSNRKADLAGGELLRNLASKAGASTNHDESLTIEYIRSQIPLLEEQAVSRGLESILNSGEEYRPATTSPGFVMLQCLSLDEYLRVQESLRVSRGTRIILDSLATALKGARFERLKLLGETTAASYVTSAVTDKKQLTRAITQLIGKPDETKHNIRLKRDERKNPGIIGQRLLCKAVGFALKSQIEYPNWQKIGEFLLTHHIIGHPAKEIMNIKQQLEATWSKQDLTITTQPGFAFVRVWLEVLRANGINYYVNPVYEAIG